MQEGAGGIVKFFFVPLIHRGGMTIRHHQQGGWTVLPARAAIPWTWWAGTIRNQAAEPARYNRRGKYIAR